MEFVLGSFSCFNIAIVYSNSTFCGAWTPSFCEFSWKLSQIQENKHTAVTLVLIQSPLTNLNLYSNSFGWQLFPINFQNLRLQKKNANNVYLWSFENCIAFQILNRCFFCQKRLKEGICFQLVLTPVKWDLIVGVFKELRPKQKCRKSAKYSVRNKSSMEWQLNLNYSMWSFDKKQPIWKGIFLFWNKTPE